MPRNGEPRYRHLTNLWNGPTNQPTNRSAVDGGYIAARHRGEVFAMQSQRRRIQLAAVAALAIPVLAGTASLGNPPAAQARQVLAVTAYVLNGGAVTPINTATNKPGTAIPTGGSSFAMVITPNGKKVYVNGFNGGGTVLPISTATNKAGTAIVVARVPDALAVTPDSKTLYIADQDSNDLIAVSTATGQAVGFVPTGDTPVAVTITPNGAKGYVADFGDSTVTPFTVATNAAGAAIKVSSVPIGIAITPDSKTAYVVGVKSDGVTRTVTPIRTATNTALKPIGVGTGSSSIVPSDIAITPNGKTAYVATNLGVTPINTATNVRGKLIKVPGSAIAITPDGRIAYVVAGSGTVTPIRTATNRALKPIHVGTNASDVAITPNGSTAYVTSNLGVTPINVATNKPGKLIKVPGGAGLIMITRIP
jgi:YVTN family beta-propeller protein